MIRLRSLLLLSTILAGAGALAASACGGGGFDSQSKVSSVRMFGVRADKPYAKPGEDVTLEVLATDARRDKPRPMKIYWMVVCMNPRDDLYYLCFLPPGQEGDDGAQLLPPFASDAGAPALAAGGASPLEQIPKGVDLGRLLPQGPTFGFRMPEDAIKPRLGTPPYGLAIVFNVACAGQVRLAERSGDNPQQIPIQCTDEEGAPLGPNDFVIGINRVYSYADRANENPVVERVTLDGVDVDLRQGITVDRCVATRRADCKPVKIDVKVPDGSWEENPGEGHAAGQREQIWATYYSDVGDLRDEARLLFDSTKGRVTDSDVEFRPPYEPTSGTLWVVVHDNRAGAAFVTVPLHVH